MCNIPPCFPPTVSACASQVVSTGKKVTRETLSKNIMVIKQAVEELGYRVSVDTCALHVQAFYEMLDAAVGGQLAALKHVQCSRTFM